MDIKKRVIILWCAFVVCVITTVILWFAMNNANPEYEEVEATVLSAKTDQVVNKKTGTKTNFYRVEVEYEGKSYELGNVHSLSSYTTGRKVKAYLYNGNLYANTEGVKTSTPIAIVYFIFLFGNFGLLYIASVQTTKLHPKNNA